MKNITTKQFQLLTDEEMIWQLMTETYEPLFANGPPAPFFEYYVTSSYLEYRFLSSCRVWLDGGIPVGFVFYEGPVTEIYFILKRGYEELAGEMVRYAAEEMPGRDKTLTFMSGQTALMQAAEKLGFSEAETETDNALDLTREQPDFPLPEGYHFIKPEDIDPKKMTLCLWRGFDLGELPQEPDFAAPESGDPFMQLYLDVDGNTKAPPPHSTYEHNIVIADESGEYVCFSGMWRAEKNRLAYMEPLCTVPEHRGKGLAAAALSEHARRMKALGAEYMTGGGSPFYKKIGYNAEIVWHRFRK